jgi:hypothetical protein
VAAARAAHLGNLAYRKGAMEKGVPGDTAN